jgi:KDO2-lipid IV(A) lauroyltransferase
MSKLKYHLIISPIKAAGILSLGLAQRLGKWGGKLAWILGTDARKVTETNIRLCFPGLSEEKQLELARASLMHTGMAVMEIPLMWEWPVEKCLEQVRETRGTELVNQALAAGNGLILLAPHLGNWELAGLYFSTYHDMAALYSPPQIPEFEDYMVKVRGRLGSELVRGDRKGLSRLMGILREGGIVGILPDQSPRGKTNAYAPFFGIEVRTMTLPAKLLQKTGAAVLVTYAERLPDHRGFRIVVTEAEQDMADKDPTTAATALNQSVENVVRRIPEQYQWEYKRFRHQPGGRPNPYKHSGKN